MVAVASLWQPMLQDGGVLVAWDPVTNAAVISFQVHGQCLAVVADQKSVNSGQVACCMSLLMRIYATNVTLLMCRHLVRLSSHSTPPVLASLQHLRRHGRVTMFPK